MPSLQDYRAVVALAEVRHFGRAAARLGITQPSLTARLRRLEEQLEARLFRRDRRGVEPTAAGLAFVEGARRVLDAADGAARAARDAAAGHGQTLRLGTTQLAAHSILPATLAAFRRVQPLVGVSLREHTTAMLEEALAEGAVDVAFLHPPLHAPDLAERPVHRAAVRIADLGGPGAADGLVRYPRAEAPVVMGVLARRERARDASAAAPAEADTVLGAVALSLAGYGACAVPADYPHPALAAAGAAAATDLALETSVAWRRHDRRAVVRTLVEIAAAPAALSRRGRGR